MHAAEYSDKSASAFKGNRGDGLARAMAHAERDGCALIVQHSDRLARGDGDQARHLVELVLWARKAGVTLRSVQDPQTFDGMGLVYAALMGDRNHEDSARKSSATRDGLRRRKERGQPVGPLPVGYTVEHDGPDTRRVIDPATRFTVDRIFDLLEGGATFGEIARTLNADGIRTRPRASQSGKPWSSRTVSKVVHNDSYAGRGGYPALIDPERYDDIVARLKRMDPAAVQKRRGGRPPADPSYWLRGVVFCLTCGAALYTRRLAGGREYVCANVRQATGLCDAPSIPADLIERHVLDHIEGFIGDAEAWLSAQAQERDDGRQQLMGMAERLRNELAQIDDRREKVLADYERAIADGDPTARIVLEVVAKLDAQRHALATKITDTEAVIAERETTDDSGLTDSVDLLRALGQADTADALNAAMRRACTGIYAAVNDGRLRAEFALSAPGGVPYLLRHAEPASLAADRVTLSQTGTRRSSCPSRWWTSRTR